MFSEYDTLFDKFMKVLIALFAAGLALILTWLLLLMLDLGTGESKSTTGHIISSEYRPASTQSVIVKSGDLFIPVTNHVPEAYVVKVRCPEGVISVEVAPGDYSEINPDNLVHLDYIEGGVAGTLSGTEIWQE